MQFTTVHQITGELLPCVLLYNHALRSDPFSIVTASHRRMNGFRLAPYHLEDDRLGVFGVCAIPCRVLVLTVSPSTLGTCILLICYSPHQTFDSPPSAEESIHASWSCWKNLIDARVEANRLFICALVTRMPCCAIRNPTLRIML